MKKLQKKQGPSKRTVKGTRKKHQIGSRKGTTVDGHEGKRKKSSTEQIHSFRPPNEQEWIIIERGIEKFYGIGLFEKLQGNNEIIIHDDGIETTIFLVPPNLWSVLQKIKTRQVPYSAGLPVGKIKGEHFLLGIEGASIIKAWTDKIVKLTEEGSLKANYGNDIPYSWVLEQPENLKRGNYIFFINPKGECLGIGRVVNKVLQNTQFIDENIRYIKNLVDRGRYLRKE